MKIKKVLVEMLVPCCNECGTELNLITTKRSVAKEVTAENKLILEQLEKYGQFYCPVCKLSK